MKKIVITGAGGQLSSELNALQSNYKDFEFILLSAEDLNIVKYPAVAEKLQAIKPYVVINAAAYTAVDKAETDENNCFEVNKIGPFNLARVCKEVNSHLIHISTDFVFNGMKSSPYVETDETQPLSNYGKSKLQGEQEIIENSTSYSIIRTSWLYSTYGNNFVKTMMKLGAERLTLSVVYDQIGTPTNAKDLAILILDNIDQFVAHKNNIYHYSNEGVASWYDFASEIMNISNLPCQVSPILSKEYPTPATRPSYSLMDKSKVKQHFKITIPHWKSSLKNCIQALSSQM